MVKIAINGFGRIGRTTAKRILDKYPDLEIVAVNDLAKEKTLKHVFKYDDVYGVYPKKISAVFLSEKDPAKLPWKKMGIDIVLECSGYFTDKQGAGRHLKAGARKVIISASSKSKQIPTYVLGVNTKGANLKKQNIFSMASCTTNAVCPVAKVLDNEFGIVKAFLNTIHSYTPGQNKVYPDWQNKKASELSIIPATTGATKTVEECLPQLKGKLNGLALRVPTAVVSIVDFAVLLKKSASAKKINNVLKKASQTKEMKGILRVEYRAKISNDYKLNPYSAIVDANLTQAFGKLAKVFIWYDNEFGYSCRLAEFTKLVAKKL